MPAALLAVLLLAPVQLDLGLRADEYSASRLGTTPRSNTGSLTGLLSLGTALEGVHFSGSYAPTLRISSGQGTNGLTTLHALRLTGDGRPGRATLRGALTSSLGWQDFSPLAQTPVPAQGATPTPAPIDRLPSSRFLQFRSLQGDVSLGYAFTHRLNGGGSLFAVTSGGVGSAEAFLPRQQSVGGTARLGFQATRRDTFELGATGSYGVTPGTRGVQTQRAIVLAGMGSWNARFAAATQGSLGVGVGTTLNQRERARVLPIGTATLTHAVPLRGQALGFTLQASAQPAIDPLTGRGYLQGASSATAAWSPFHWGSLRGGGSASRALVGSPSGAWGAAGEISANLRLGGQSELTAGFREAVATVAAADLNASYRRQQAQWSIFVGASTGLHQAF
jgi:hypothetical protein